jgi:hypothetical protein
MTLPQFWAMIFGKQIVWDERARGRDKLAQRWVQRLRFSDTHLGLANLAQLLIERKPDNRPWVYVRTSAELPIRHLLSHVEKKLAIPFFRLGQEATKFAEITGIFTHASPSVVVR